MHATGLKEFDHTIHTTNIWLKDLMNELEWDDRHRAYHGASQYHPDYAYRHM